MSTATTNRGLEPWGTQRLLVPYEDEPTAELNPKSIEAFEELEEGIKELSNNIRDLQLMLPYAQADKTPTSRRQNSGQGHELCEEPRVDSKPGLLPSRLKRLGKVPRFWQKNRKHEERGDKSHTLARHMQDQRDDFFDDCSVVTVQTCNKSTDVERQHNLKLNPCKVRIPFQHQNKQKKEAMPFGSRQDFANVHPAQSAMGDGGSSSSEIGGTEQDKEGHSEHQNKQKKQDFANVHPAQLEKPVAMGDGGSSSCEVGGSEQDKERRSETKQSEEASRSMTLCQKHFKSPDTIDQDSDQDSEFKTQDEAQIASKSGRKAPAPTECQDAEKRLAARQSPPLTVVPRPKIELRPEVSQWLHLGLINVPNIFRQKSKEQKRVLNAGVSSEEEAGANPPDDDVVIVGEVSSSDPPVICIDLTSSDDEQEMEQVDILDSSEEEELSITFPPSLAKSRSLSSNKGILHPPKVRSFSDGSSRSERRVRFTEETLLDASHRENRMSSYRATSRIDRVLRKVMLRNEKQPDASTGKRKRKTKKKRKKKKKLQPDSKETETCNCSVSTQSTDTDTDSDDEEVMVYDPRFKRWVAVACRDKLSSPEPSTSNRFCGLDLWPFGCFQD